MGLYVYGWTIGQLDNWTTPQTQCTCVQVYAGTLLEKGVKEKGVAKLEKGVREKGVTMTTNSDTRIPEYTTPQLQCTSARGYQPGK